MSGLEDKLNATGVFTYALDVPINAGARKSIEEAIWSLERAMDGEDCHHHGDGVCSAADPHCRFHELESALVGLRAIVTPVHRSLHPDRQGSAAEDVYLKRWVKEQETSPGINRGFGLLESILAPTRQPYRSSMGSPERIFTPAVSQRDAEVAATVVQWLGTACGMGFVSECEREIKRCNAERDAMETHLLRCINGMPVRPDWESLALEAARWGCRPDDKKHAELVRHILAAIAVSHKTPEGGLC